MLAWWVRCTRPSTRRGRDVLIANDITYQNGTFAPEDRVFERASQLAASAASPACTWRRTAARASA